ncbi:MAG: hypothetical protein H8D23_10715 [Candidatus Brocadiales bacterium]|nr:hypothetical protein [Candidatus Brocadiales bacterium]
MDAELSYPVTANQLYEYFNTTLGIPGNEMVVINKDHPEEIAREEALTEKEYEVKLTDSEYKDADTINASEHLGDEYNENFLKSLETRKYEFASKE